MFTPRDLGIDPSARAAIPERPVTELEVGSISAPALFALFQGEPATTIVSPFGVRSVRSPGASSVLGAAAQESPIVTVSSPVYVDA